MRRFAEYFRHFLGVAFWTDLAPPRHLKPLGSGETHSNLLLGKLLKLQSIDESHYRFLGQRFSM